ncbi:MAG: OmpH family outer membrane protein [Candidatus Zixiibacteriota bacterium]
MHFFKKSFWIFIIGSALALIVFNSFSYSQEGKLGYIDSMRIRAEYKEFEDAQAQFDKDVARWEAQADTMRKEIDSLQTDLDKKGLLYSETTKNEKESQVESLKTQYQRFVNDTFGPGGKAERRNAELTKPIIDKINQVLEKVAIENNFAMVFDSVGGNLAYANKALDLTDKVLEELKKLE